MKRVLIVVAVLILVGIGLVVPITPKAPVVSIGEEAVVAALEAKGYNDIHIVRSYPSALFYKRARMVGRGFDITATYDGKTFTTYAFFRPVNGSVEFFDHPGRER